MQGRQTDMLSGKIVKQLLLFFFPIMFGSIFQQLYNTVDAIIVGNFVGKEALAAVGGSTGTFIDLLVGFVVGLSSGATVVVAQYYGRREAEGVHKSVSTSIFLAITLGAVLMILGIVFAPVILNLLNVPVDILPFSITYLRVYLVGMIPVLIYNNGAGILRAVGDSKRPLYFLIASACTNIVLDLVFVIVFHMGVAGVALATAISQTVSCILTLLTLSRTEDIYSFHIRDMKIDFAVFKRILVIGFPMGIQSCLYAISNLFIQRGVNTYGTDTVASFTAFGKIDALFWNSSGALGQAVLTFCGQNFGAGDVKRVKKGIHAGILIYLVGSSIISVTLYFFGGVFFRLFTPDNMVISIGLGILRFMCPLWPTFCLIEVFSSAMRACGDSLVPMLMTAIGIGAFRIAWILFYPATNIYDTMLCYPISWILLDVMFIFYYLQGGWLKRSLKQREKLIEANRSC